MAHNSKTIQPNSFQNCHTIRPDILSSIQNTNSRHHIDRTMQAPHTTMTSHNHYNNNNRPYANTHQIMPNGHILNSMQAPNFNQQTQAPNYNQSAVPNFYQYSTMPNFNQYTNMPNFNGSHMLNHNQHPNTSNFNHVPSQNQHTNVSNFNHNHVPNQNQHTKAFHSNHNHVSNQKQHTNASNLNHFNVSNTNQRTNAFNSNYNHVPNQNQHTNASNFNSTHLPNPNEKQHTNAPNFNHNHVPNQNQHTNAFNSNYNHVPNQNQHTNASNFNGTHIPNPNQKQHTNTSNFKHDHVPNQNQHTNASNLNHNHVPNRNQHKNSSKFNHHHHVSNPNQFSVNPITPCPNSYKSVANQSIAKPNVSAPNVSKAQSNGIPCERKTNAIETRKRSTCRRGSSLCKIDEETDNADEDSDKDTSEEDCDDSAIKKSANNSKHPRKDDESNSEDSDAYNSSLASNSISLNTNEDHLDEDLRSDDEGIRTDNDCDDLEEDVDTGSTKVILKREQGGTGQRNAENINTFKNRIKANVVGNDDSPAINRDSAIEDTFKSVRTGSNEIDVRMNGREDNDTSGIVSANVLGEVGTDDEVSSNLEDGDLEDITKSIATSDVGSEEGGAVLEELEIDGGVFKEETFSKRRDHLESQVIRQKFESTESQGYSNVRPTKGAFVKVPPRGKAHNLSLPLKTGHYMNASQSVGHILSLPQGIGHNLSPTQGIAQNMISPQGMAQNMSSPPGLAQNMSSPKGMAQNMSSPQGIIQNMSSTQGMAQNMSSPPGLAQNMSSPQGMAQNMSSPQGIIQNMSSPQGMAQNMSSPPGLAQNMTSPQGMAQNMSSPQGIIQNMSSTQGMIQNMSSPQEVAHSWSVTQGMGHNFNEPQRINHSINPSQKNSQNLIPPQEISHHLSPTQEMAENMNLPQEMGHSWSLFQGISHNMSLSQGMAHNLSPSQGMSHNLSLSQGMGHNLSLPQRMDHNLSQMASERHLIQTLERDGHNMNLVSKLAHTMPEDIGCSCQNCHAIRPDILANIQNSNSIPPNPRFDALHIVKTMHGAHNTINNNTNNSNGHCANSYQNIPNGPILNSMQVPNFNHQNYSSNFNQFAVPNFYQSNMSNFNKDTNAPNFNHGHVPNTNQFSVNQTNPCPTSFNSVSNPAIEKPVLSNETPSERKANAIETRKRSTCRTSLSKIDEESMFCGAVNEMKSDVSSDLGDSDLDDTKSIPTSEVGSEEEALLEALEIDRDVRNEEQFSGGYPYMQHMQRSCVKFPHQRTANNLGLPHGTGLNLCQPQGMGHHFNLSQGIVEDLSLSQGIGHNLNQPQGMGHHLSLMVHEVHPMQVFERVGHNLSPVSKGVHTIMPQDIGYNLRLIGNGAQLPSERMEKKSNLRLTGNVGDCMQPFHRPQKQNPSSNNNENSEILDNTTETECTEESEIESDDDIGDLVLKRKLEKIYANLDQKIQLSNSNYLRGLFQTDSPHPEEVTSFRENTVEDDLLDNINRLNICEEGVPKEHLYNGNFTGYGVPNTPTHLSNLDGNDPQLNSQRADPFSDNNGPSVSLLNFAPNLENLIGFPNFQDVQGLPRAFSTQTTTASNNDPLNSSRNLKGASTRPMKSPDSGLDNALSSCEFAHVWNDLDKTKSELNVVLFDVDTACERINELKQLINLKNNLLKFLINNKPLREEVRAKVETKSVQLKAKLKSLKKDLYELKHMEEKMNIDKLNMKFKKNRNGSDANKQLILFNHLNRTNADEEPRCGSRKSHKRVRRHRDLDGSAKIVELSDNHDLYSQNSAFPWSEIGHKVGYNELPAVAAVHPIEAIGDPVSSTETNMVANIHRLKREIDMCESRLQNLCVITKITLQSDEQIEELNKNLSKWTKRLTTFEKLIESEKTKKEQLKNDLVLNMYKIKSMEETFNRDRQKCEVLNDINMLIERLKPIGHIDVVKRDIDVSGSDKTIVTNTPINGSENKLDSVQKRDRNMSANEVKTATNVSGNDLNTDANNSNTDMTAGDIKSGTIVSASDVKRGTIVNISHGKSDIGVNSSDVKRDTDSGASNVKRDTHVNGSDVKRNTIVNADDRKKEADSSANLVKRDTHASSSDKNVVLNTLMNGSEKKLDNLLETESSIDTLGSTSMRNFKMTNSTEISDNAISVTAISDKSGGVASNNESKRKKKSSLSRAFSFRKSHNTVNSSGQCASIERSAEKTPSEKPEKSTTGKKIKNFILNKSGDKNKSNDSIRFKKPDDQLSNCSGQSNNRLTGRDEDKLSNSSLASKLRVIVENNARDGKINGEERNAKLSSSEKRPHAETSGGNGGLNGETASNLDGPCCQQASQCHGQSQTSQRIESHTSSQNAREYTGGNRTENGETIVNDNSNAVENVKAKRDTLRAEIAKLLELKNIIVEKRMKLFPNKCSDQSELNRKLFFEYDETIETVDVLVEHKGNVIRELDDNDNSGKDRRGNELESYIANAIRNRNANCCIDGSHSGESCRNGPFSNTAQDVNNGRNGKSPNSNHTRGNASSGRSNSILTNNNDLYHTLIDKLINLNYNELVLIVYKYFNRIVDLRSTSVELEKLVQSLDYKLEMKIATEQEMNLKFERLHQNNQISNEKHLTLLQKDYQHKLHLFYRCYCSDRTDAAHTQSASPTGEVNDTFLLREENKFLKSKVKYLETQLRKMEEKAGGDAIVPFQTVVGSNKTITMENNKLVISKRH